MRPLRKRNAPTRPKAPVSKTPKTPNVARATEPVEVHCRIRPPENSEDEICCLASSSTLVELTQPNGYSLNRNGTAKGMHCSFKHVFGPDATQKQVFDSATFPLVSDLLHGKNGLLFCYGITGSGKTYTMSGTASNPGMMMRVLDVVFNSLGELQAPKYVFKPDKMNGFDLQSKVDAMAEWQQELQKPHGLYTRIPKTPGRHAASKFRTRDVPGEFSEDDDLPVDIGHTENAKIDRLNEDNLYAVFISYVEIYNNYVYDLLEDTPVGITATPGRNHQMFESKVMRPDAKNNMYVVGGTEVEVQNTEEAFFWFLKGQKRRRVASTALNTESSRSHSIFNIRVVQVPLDPQGEDVFLDKNSVHITQLSLVDLAGSEKPRGTNATGDRLREAGNINNSLLVLRTCIEILRENQKDGGNRLPPFRSSRLTNLFKNYFEGEGKVTMVVCVNPVATCYDETEKVMKFAEMAKDVQIARSEELPPDIGLAPGRSKANKIYKEAMKKMESEGFDTQNIPLDIMPVYSLGPDFPNLELTDPACETIISELVAFLKRRCQIRKTIEESYHEKFSVVRDQVANMEHGYILIKQENMSLQAQLKHVMDHARVLEGKMINAETANINLQKKVEDANLVRRTLEEELEEKEMQLNKRRLDKQRLETRLDTKLHLAREKLEKEYDRKLKQQKQHFRNEALQNQEKLKQVRRILNSEQMLPSSSIVTRSSSDTDSDGLRVSARTRYLQEVGRRGGVIPKQPPAVPPKNLRGPAVSNKARRRSRSVGDEHWLDHQSVQAVNAGTLLHPEMKRRKSVTKLTDIKDVTNTRTTKYCLTRQEQDTDGELEIQYYKGDILPTTGGGAQVIFSDVEILQQRSPENVHKRKSDPVGDLENIADRCNMAIEGHGRQNKRVRR